MGEWGINNYQPQWNHSATDLLNAIVQTPLIGLQVQAIWSLWDEESDEWFSDAPIIIRTQEQQLEFCATELNKFSFSLNSIDLNCPVYWCTDEDEDIDTKPFFWVQNRNPEFRNLVGEIFTGIEIVEFHVERDTRAFLRIEEWILSGVALQFESDRLEILNGLDCNSLSRDRHTREKVRYIRVPTTENK